MPVDKSTRQAVRSAMKQDRAKKRAAKKIGRAQVLDVKAEKAEGKGKSVRATRLRVRADKKKAAARSKLKKAGIKSKGKQKKYSRNRSVKV